MGNTISTGKLIGAFNGTNGEAVYVMFEQTCESNVYPRRPKWNAQMIGCIPVSYTHLTLPTIYSV